VVPDAVAFVRRDLGCPDVHAAIELHRIGIDHLGVTESSAQLDGE